MRQRWKDSYSETGCPSIDPELLLRILLIGYLYGVTSERKLVEDLRLHLAWRWLKGDFSPTALLLYQHHSLVEIECAGFMEAVGLTTAP